MQKVQIKKQEKDGELDRMKVCVLTGTRAEYGLLKPIIEAIDKSKKLELSLIVASMHLSKEFGNTIDEIRKDGFGVNGIIHMLPSKDTSYAMASSIGEGITYMTKLFKKIKPDILLVLGDRTEALAGTITAVYSNITVAHIHGGDTTRDGLDESARHAITKFAHIHFPATEKSAECIRRLGEDKWRIHISGSPCLDTILYTKLYGKEELEKRLKLDLDKTTTLMIQHSVSTEPEKAEEQVTETLEAIKELKYQTVIIYPNSDAGGRKIIKKIKTYSILPFIITFKSLSHKEYLSLMKYSKVMVGNSSSGIIESSSFNLPVVNIGMRQEGRERANNVVDVEHNKEDIIKAIKDCLRMELTCENPYGYGHATKIIVKVLSSLKIDDRLMQKRITY